MVLPLLKCPSHNLRLLSVYPSFKIHFWYTFSKPFLTIFYYCKQTVFFYFCYFVNLLGNFSVLCSYWYFLCYSLPNYKLLVIKDLVLLVFGYLWANCLTCESVHVICVQFDYGNTLGLRLVWTLATQCFKACFISSI